MEYSSYNSDVKKHTHTKIMKKFCMHHVLSTHSQSRPFDILRSKDLVRNQTQNESKDLKKAKLAYQCQLQIQAALDVY